jgi:NADH dehydrogenase
VIVTEVDGSGLTFRNESGASERLATRTVLWAGGVQPGGFGRILAARTGAPTDRSGRIKVRPDLTVPGFPEIFVVGDLAAFADEEGHQLPGVAQVAMQGGAYAARIIAARAQAKTPGMGPFHYSDRGDISVIGRAAAVARIFGLHLHGLIAWLVWLFIHLMYLVQFQSRILVFIQWGFQYLTFSRGARLITGSEAANALAGGSGSRGIRE